MRIGALAGWLAPTKYKRERETNIQKRLNLPRWKVGRCDNYLTIFKAFDPTALRQFSERGVVIQQPRHAVDRRFSSGIFNSNSANDSHQDSGGHAFTYFQLHLAGAKMVRFRAAFCTE